MFRLEGWRGQKVDELGQKRQRLGSSLSIPTARSGSSVKKKAAKPDKKQGKQVQTGLLC
jgi:hypothetical protein